MADRTPYRAPELREQLRPQAAPVDTFVTPPQVVPNEGLLGLARGLSALDAGLSDFLAKRKAEQDDADRIQAETDFHKNNRAGFAEAVATGKVPAYASKAYVGGYKEAQGRIAGYQLEEKFRAAYDAWPEKGAQDPAKFDGFLQDFLRTNIGTTDPMVLRGVVPRLRNLVDGAYSRNSQDRHKALVEGRLRAAGTEANIALDTVYTEGFKNPGGFNYESGWKQLEAIRQRAVEEGSNSDAVDKALIDAVTAKAIEKRRPEYLEFLKRKVPGKDYTYGSTPYGQDQLQKTIDTLEVHGRRMLAEEERRRQAAVKAETEEVTRKTIEHIMADPEAPIPDEILKRGAALDGDFRIKARNWQASEAERSRRAKLEAVSREVGERLAKDPTAPIPEELLKRGADLDGDFRIKAGNWQESLKGRANKGELEAVTRETIEQLTRNPDVLPSEELLKRGAGLDGDFRIKVNGWRDNIRKGQASASPEALRDLNYEIIRSGGKNVARIIQKGIENGVLNNKDDLVAAYKLGEEMRKNGAKLESIMGSSSAKTIRGAINKRTQSEKDIGNIFAPEGISDTGLAAQYDFDRLLAEWVTKNPDASAQEQEKAIAEIGATILGRLERADDGAGKESYRRDPGLQFNNPFQQAQPGQAGQPQAPQQAAPQAPQEAPQPAPAPQPTTPAPQPAPAAPVAPQGQQGAIDGGAAQWYLNLPPEQRANAEREAARSGKPLSEIISRGWARQQQQQPQATPQSAPGAAPDGTPVQPISLVQQAQDTLREVLGDDVEIDEERVVEIARSLAGMLAGSPAPGQAPSRSFTLSSLRDDPQAARILDFIAGPESRGNYNAVFGRADNEHDLSQYTVGDILAGKHFEALGGRVKGQSATGRYQIINKTLRGLASEMGLTGEERFTPQLQDRMALQLMRGRGYEDFRSGKITSEQFASQLAKEWAGLPDPRTGRSAYEGDGLNKAGVSTKAFLDVLRTGGSSSEAPKAAALGTGRYGPGDVYANIPERDGRGNDQIALFMRWNPDPVGNHEKNLSSIEPTLASVVRKAQADNPGLRFVVGSGKRDAELQKVALAAGWSKTSESNHLHGEAVDLWPLDDKGRVKFDPAMQKAIGEAVKRAAAELGVAINWGGDWKKFVDLPHFELKGASRSARTAKKGTSV